MHCPCNAETCDSSVNLYNMKFLNKYITVVLVNKTIYPLNRELNVLPKKRS